MAKQTIINPTNQDTYLLDVKPQDNGFEVVIDEQTYLVSFDVIEMVRKGDRSSGRGVLRHQQSVIPCHWLREATRLELWLEGRVYHLEVPDNTPQRGNAQGGGAVSGDIKSPMPGSILQVLVKEGDSISAGDALIIMESMKMEMTLSAPADATVKSIHCKPAELTELGQLLVALDLVSDE